MKTKTELAFFCLKFSVLLLFSLPAAQGQEGVEATEPVSVSEPEASEPQAPTADPDSGGASGDTQQVGEPSAAPANETATEEAPVPAGEKEPGTVDQGVPGESSQGTQDELPKDGAPPDGKRLKKQKHAGSDQPEEKGKLAEKPADFHADTPQWLRNRLRLSTAASFGVGSGETEDFSSDYMGFSVSGLYAVHKVTTGALTINVVSGARYATHTGVLTDANKEASVQRFLLLAGSEFRPQKAEYRFGALVGLGLAKNTEAGFASTNRFTSSYGFALSVEASFAYQVYKEIALQTALEAAPLDNGWYGLSVGPSLSF